MTYNAQPIAQEHRLRMAEYVTRVNALVELVQNAFIDHGQNFSVSGSITFSRK